MPLRAQLKCIQVQVSGFIFLIRQVKKHQQQDTGTLLPLTRLMPDTSPRERQTSRLFLSMTPFTLARQVLGNQQWLEHSKIKENKTKKPTNKQTTHHKQEPQTKPNNPPKTKQKPHQTLISKRLWL